MSTVIRPPADRGITLLVTVAHPDDESFGCGSLITAAAEAGWRVVVCCASRGEAGEDASGLYAEPELLGAAREAELRAAATVLGVEVVEVLGFADSGWSGPAPTHSLVDDLPALVDEISRTIQAHRPDVVVTMDPSGSDGHRDHAAIGAAATQAFQQTVDWPASLYHWFLPRSLMNQWAREIAANDPDSVYLQTELGRTDDDVTTVIDGSLILKRRWQAIDCHATQSSPYAGVSPELAAAFIGRDHLVRIIPPWSGGPRESALHVPALDPLRERDQDT